MINIREKEDWDWIDTKITARMLEIIINWGQRLNDIKELDSRDYNVLQMMYSQYYRHNLNKEE